FPQKDTSYREVHRVLAPGGRYLFSVWDSHRHNPFGRIAHETAASFFPADPPQFYMVPFSYYQIDPIKESLIDAGFTDISVAVIRLEKEIPDTARFARGLVDGNPLIDQIKARGGVDPDRVVNALAQALRQEFGARACPSIPKRAFGCRGRKQDERARWFAVVSLAPKKRLFLNVRRRRLLVSPFGKKFCDINERHNPF